MSLGFKKPSTSFLSVLLCSNSYVVVCFASLVVVGTCLYNVFNI